ncbi:hypothetical protein OOU_Y34scaffold01145g2 [Pyricularia oryzae Y34]|uniref:Uncharacterized protein n=1 Tax=Pyricularia oryzae (strain Y34) TaxID=1143189 RepID=A0AA97NLR8_PYRO3|nr:hypothetical protein OOU_Y34scaffold01145g2 [Pyricularia oryzae Y34]
MPPKKLQSADYHVAWIAPVSSLELLPSRLMLDEHDASDYDTAYDDNVYTCGAIAGHNVVIATCAPGMTGNVNAGRVTGRRLGFSTMGIRPLDLALEPPIQPVSQASSGTATPSLG